MACLESVPSIKYKMAERHLAITITDMPLPGNIIDHIFCTHVLAHVSYDTVAMNELY